jgi:hypothetical protein
MVKVLNARNFETATFDVSNHSDVSRCARTRFGRTTFGPLEQRVHQCL